MVAMQNQREHGRKERAKEELYRQIRRYDYECSDIKTFKLNKEELSEILKDSNKLENVIRRKYESRTYCVQPKSNPYIK